MSRLLAITVALSMAFAVLPPLAAQTKNPASAEKARAENYAKQRLEYASSPNYNPSIPTRSAAENFRVLLTRNRHQEALALVDSLLEKSPLSPELHLLRSTALRRLGRAREATEESNIIRDLENATILNFTATGYDNAFDTILQTDPETVARALKRKIVRERKETRDGRTYVIYAMKWAIDTSIDAETRDFYFNTDRLETWRKNNPKSAATPKKSGVKIGAATVVTDTTGDSGPTLISTTGGAGGNDTKWHNLATLQKAADEQNPEALYELGMSYLQGAPYTPKNITRALLNLDEAARLGHAAASFRLGKLYADGDEIPRDQRKALSYYTAAARAGDPIAQHNVGAMISSGRGVEKRDYAEGLAWLIIAARKNPEAAEGEKKLREFLAKYPQTIAAGEARAVELEKELAAPRSAPQPSGPARPKMEAPKLDIAPMPVPAPTMTIPPPTFTPGDTGD